MIAILNALVCLCLTYLLVQQCRDPIGHRFGVRFWISLVLLVGNALALVVWAHRR